MSKLTAPLHSFLASGPIGKVLSFRRSHGLTIAEKQPHFPDQKTPAQLNQRLMYQQCTDLWNLLSTAEKKEWDSLARPKHMPPYAMFMSYCLKPNPGVYLPLAGGTMSGNIAMAGAQTVDGIDISAHAADLDAHTRNFLKQWKISQYYYPYSGTAITINLDANVIHATPLTIARPITIDRIACHITTQAGQNIRMGIYADNGNIYPGALIKDAGEITLAAIGVQAIIINPALSLDKGLYWPCIISNGAPTAIAIYRWTVYPSPLGIKATDFTVTNAQHDVVQAYGALPGSYPAGAGISTYPFLVLIRIASLA